MKHNEVLAEHAIEKQIRQLLSKYKNEIGGHNNTNKHYKFFHNVSQILDLRSSDKQVALQNFFLITLRKT